MAGVTGTRIAGAVARHPLAWGAAWSALLAVATAAGIAAGWPGWVLGALLALLVAPSLAATVAVLHATPRRRFDEISSVFGHFAIRYVALVIGVIAWSLSVVVGAAISAVIQLAAEGREADIVGVGLDIMLVIVPTVVGLLWAAFVLRCAWFLARIRGWRELPAGDGVPADLLAERPGLRRTVVALAHPALFGLSGLFVACALPFLQGSVEILLA
ncbi:hypothetical protein GCM10009571_07970 [Agromyces luteolus]|uniref:Uncharacterized protein n=1 Tax=Agromyces luteolus TaxID=88373 RepID=A0A7C9LDE9_9MICO|nr:hypothetical protein [Agromyces luteolus]MUN06951.1 hypothetical protein [Agromyces luteolus]